MTTAALDCTWGRGPRALVEQHAIGARCAELWGCEVHFSPTGPASVDAVFTCDRELIAVAEIKARSLTLAQLRAMPAPQGYLITRDKLTRGRAASQQFGVPFDLLVGLVDWIVQWRITNREGAWLVTFETHTTRTQRTCNGGDARRANAYLPLSAMRLIARRERL